MEWVYAQRHTYLCTTLCIPLLLLCRAPWAVWDSALWVPAWHRGVLRFLAGCLHTVCHLLVSQQATHRDVKCLLRWCLNHRRWLCQPGCRQRPCLQASSSSPSAASYPVTRGVSKVCGCHWPCFARPYSGGSASKKTNPKSSHRNRAIAKQLNGSGASGRSLWFNAPLLLVSCRRIRAWGKVPG